MKAIMAETAHGKTNESQLAVSLPIPRASILSGGDIMLGAPAKINQRIPQRERRKLQRQLTTDSGDLTAALANPSRPTDLSRPINISSPWRTHSAPNATNRTDTLEYPPPHATPVPVPSSSLTGSNDTNTQVITKSISSAKQRVQIPLGPVISPSRQAVVTGSPPSRNVSYVHNS